MTNTAILADTPLRIVHVLLLVSWLGVDVGVFYASIRLRRAAVSGETRLELTRIMTVLDLGPRISLLLMIPVAAGLAWASGLGLQDLGEEVVRDLVEV